MSAYFVHSLRRHLAREQQNTSSRCRNLQRLRFKFVHKTKRGPNYEVEAAAVFLVNTSTFRDTTSYNQKVLAGVFVTSTCN